MPKQKPVDSQIRPKIFSSVQEISHGIERLRGRIVQVEELKKDGLPYRDALKVTAEYQLRDTIKEIFGEHSPEYHQHQHLKIRVGSKAAIDDTVKLLRDLVVSLEERRLELLGIRKEVQVHAHPAAPVGFVEPTKGGDTGGPTPTPPDSGKLSEMMLESSTRIVDPVPANLPQAPAAPMPSAPSMQSQTERRSSMPSHAPSREGAAVATVSTPPGAHPSPDGASTPPSIIDHPVAAAGTASSEGVVGTPYSAILRICSRFHNVVRQLRQRREDRPTLEVEDETDVQDLLQVLLSVEFDDIQTEAWTPSYDGGASRADLFLKQEGIMLVVRKTKQGLSVKTLADHIALDIERYLNHSQCRTLIYFIYDPEGRIGNPRALEAGLRREQNGRRVDVVISPK
jgi:hypothetical protein